MTEHWRLLLLEDSPVDARLIQRIVTRANSFEIDWVHVGTLHDAFCELKKGVFDAALIDLIVPDSSGLETISRLLVQSPDLPVIALTGCDDEELAREAVQQGAQDYLVKWPSDGRAVLHSISHAIERQRLLLALRSNEARLRAIFEKNIDGILVVDKQGRICFTNPAAKSLVQQDFKGLQDVIQAIPQAVDEPAEVEIAAVSGRKLVLDVRVVELQWEGQPAFLAMLRDITERKWAEREVLEKNRDLETLLYVISHDLREPLRAVQNFAGLVNERYADKLDERGRDYLQRVVQRADRLDLLISDILVLSRAQRTVNVADEVDGAEIVREAIDRLEVRVQQSQAKIQVLGGLGRMRVDKKWATQAVFNLITNALKFAEPGVPPDIEIGPYPDASQGELRPLGLVVRDRGLGVPPEFAERIFELFQRAVGREIEGTGAGLAIVRQIAERHGGTAWVESRQGGGSEFYITFGQHESEV